jgi:hypothetical protein
MRVPGLDPGINPRISFSSSFRRKPQIQLHFAAAQSWTPTFVGVTNSKTPAASSPGHDDIPDRHARIATHRHSGESRKSSFTLQPLKAGPRLSSG